MLINIDDNYNYDDIYGYEGGIHLLLKRLPDPVSLP